MKFIQALACYINQCRVIVVMGFIITTIMVPVFPLKMSGAPPWSYYRGIKNFAHGDFVINDQLHATQINDTR